MGKEEKKKGRKGEIYRREFLSGASLVIGSAAIGSSLAARAGTKETIEAAAHISPQTATRTPAKTVGAKISPEYEVVTPRGVSATKMITMAPRLDTLEGKTICMVSNGLFKHEVTFPVIEDLLKKKYPTAKVIPYTEMPLSHSPGDLSSKATTSLMAAMKEKGCNAVIGGNGG